MKCSFQKVFLLAMMNENLKKTIFSEENISNNVMKEIVKLI
jgi:hypothetical protein